jgi:hypothetical protein
MLFQVHEGNHSPPPTTHTKQTGSYFKGANNTTNRQERIGIKVNKQRRRVAEQWSRFLRKLKTRRLEKSLFYH